MANAIIKKRYTDLAFYTKSDAQDFPQKRAELMATFGREAQQAAKLANIPLTVLQSVVLVENYQLDASLVNFAGFTGLGQIGTGTASDVIIREHKAKRLSDQETAVLRKTLGKKLDVLFMDDIDPQKAGNQRVNLGHSIVKREDLKDPEFNLMIAAIFISQLINEEIEGNLVRLDRVIVRYNQGYYYKIPALKTDRLIGQLPSEPKNYIKKMAGANGFMETLA